MVLTGFELDLPPESYVYVCGQLLTVLSDVLPARRARRLSSRTSERSRVAQTTQGVRQTGHLQPPSSAATPQAGLKQK